MDSIRVTPECSVCRRRVQRSPASHDSLLVVGFGGGGSVYVPPTGTSRRAAHHSQQTRWEAVTRKSPPRLAPTSRRRWPRLPRVRARARGDSHARPPGAPPQFSHLSDPRRSPLATAAPRRLPAQVQRPGDEHPVQGVHGHFPVHHVRGEAQGARRQQAPEERFLPVLPPPQAVKQTRDSPRRRGTDRRRHANLHAAALAPRRRARSRVTARVPARGSHRTSMSKS